MRERRGGLALASNTEGASGNITISGNTSGLTFNQAVTGANASLTVDGVPITSTSNSVTGVIPGVTSSISPALPPNTNVSLTLSPDVQQAGDAISAFVTAWNKVVGDINTQFSVQS